MISGVVRPNLEATLPLTVFNAGGQSQTIEAVVDTGFNGFLTLTPALVAQLGLSWLSSEYAELADGSIQLFDVHAATVFWDGQMRELEVEAADAAPLIGMRLLQGYDLRMRVVVGGEVSVTAIC